MRDRGTAAQLHAPPAELPQARAVRVCEVTAPALVLGRSQPCADIDRARAGARHVELVRRPSGGGAVWVAPGSLVWVELWLPRRDPLWEDDVRLAPLWVGRAWAAALRDLGVAGTAVHRGAPVDTVWSAKVCFAGLAAGEVTAGGAKVVGVSQRRSAEGARFQCAALLRWDPLEVLDLLVLGEAARAEAAAVLAGAAGAVTADLPELVAALVERLP